MFKLPDIIVDIGVNYYDIAEEQGITPFDAALLMIEQAQKAGADAVKFQTYKAEKLAAVDSPAYWDLNEEPTSSQRELFAKYDSFDQQHYKKLASYCSDLKIEFMTTAFDTDSVAIVNPLVSRHKIASADITNIELLEAVGASKKPVLLSTGASNITEINQAVSILQKAGASGITLLHCVLNYPTAIEQAKLWKIKALRSKYPALKVGYSDHTRYCPEILTTAWILGAVVIEKHFTLNRSLKGNDHYHAAEPSDIAALLSIFNRISAGIGREETNWHGPAEDKARRYARRGVYLVKDIIAGNPIKGEDVAFLRPQAEGITPVEWASFLKAGKRYGCDLKAGTLVTDSVII